MKVSSICLFWHFKSTVWKFHGPFVTISLRKTCDLTHTHLKLSKYFRKSKEVVWESALESHQTFRHLSFLTYYCYHARLYNHVPVQSRKCSKCTRNFDGSYHLLSTVWFQMYSLVLNRRHGELDKNMANLNFFMTIVQWFLNRF